MIKPHLKYLLLTVPYQVTEGEYDDRTISNLVNLYEKRFITETGGVRGYDVPWYSLYSVTFRYNGKTHKSIVRGSSMDTVQAKASGIAAALRKIGYKNGREIGAVIKDIQSRPRDFGLKVQYLHDLPQQPRRRSS